MDFSHYLLSSLPLKERLLSFGFIESDNLLLLKRALNEDFYVLISISSSEFSAFVFETSTDEKYDLFDVPSAKGAFVGKIREQVSLLVRKIHNSCFQSSDLKSPYVEWIKNHLGIEGDYPWEDDSSSAVYRCKNGKWFALVMRIKFKNLGFSSDEPVWVVNLKTDAEKIPELVDKKSIFPAWHMNKKYWITVILTPLTDFEKLKVLTLRSKELVESKNS